MKKVKTLALLAVIILPVTAIAHGGRLNSEGCHNNSKTGMYECHGAPQIRMARTAAPTQARMYAPGDKNCADFLTQQEAQDFYVLNGGPLIDGHDLDRDKDGIACEALR